MTEVISGDAGTNDIAQVYSDVTLETMSKAAVERVAALSREHLKLPQLDIPTEHVFHGGMYARTIKIPPHAILTGTLIKVPTLFIVNGDVVIGMEDRAVRVAGHAVLCGQAGRKQVVQTIGQTFITMIFPTEAKTVEAVEAEFTDETELLASRSDTATNYVRGL